MAGKCHPSGHAKKFGFCLQAAAARTGKRVNKVGTRVVTGTPVFVTGVAQTYNQLDGSQRWYPVETRLAASVSLKPQGPRGLVLAFAFSFAVFVSRSFITFSRCCFFIGLTNALGRNDRGNRQVVVFAQCQGNRYDVFR